MRPRVPGNYGASGGLPRQRCRRGMTLIEVLLATALMGVGLSVLLTGAARCLGVVKRSREYQMAQWALGMGMLEHPIEFLSEDDDLIDIEDLEVDPVDYDGFVFSREVMDDEDEDGLYAVHTHVSWESGGKQKTEVRVQYVFWPEELL